MSFSTTNSGNRVVYGSNSLAVKGARFTRRGGGNNTGGTSYNYYYSQPQGDSNGIVNSDGLLSVGSSSINMNTMKTLDKLQQVPKSGSTGSTTASVGIANSSHGESNGLSVLYPSSTNKSVVGPSANSYALNSNASPKTMGSGVGSSVLSNRLDNKQMSPLDEKHPYSLGAGNGSSMGGANIMGQQNIAPVAPSTIATAAPAHNYWMYPSRGSVEDDIVTIHVCDESQQTSRDFCCKRTILVKNMKYFEKFLADNESGYDDIDISVHCDVEIFEWLMNYIHNKVGEESRTPVVNLNPNNNNKSATLHIDKAILISILISSEFLQMDSLVDICIQNVASNLNEIIKLPIDLSCISERLINRIAAITPSRMLADTRDKKDKILTKLYKRRVELDFSRKGSTKGSNGTSSRTIAASLTCCRYCGWVYLESYVAFLTCRNSPSTIDFRGRLSSRHYSVTGWSLTSYLKTLHAGGMGWDAIYWHVWAACVVLRVNETFISVLEADRYTVESDGLLIRNGIVHESDLLTNSDSSDGGATAEAKLGTGSAVKPVPSFSLGLDDCGDSLNAVIDFKTQKMLVSKSNDEKSYSFMIASSSGDGQPPTGPIPTSSLNPNRPPECLTTEIFELIGSQMKFIVGLSHRLLIQNTAKTVIENFASAELAAPGTSSEYFEIMWGYGAPTLFQKDGNGGSKSSKSNGVISEQDENERRRGRSPVGRGSVRASSLESRKPTVNSNNSSKFKPVGSSNTVAGSKNGSVSEKGGSSNDSGNDSDSNNYDSDEEQVKERKPRSYSLGNSRISRLNQSHNNTSKGNNNGISSTRKKPDISSSSQVTANDTPTDTSAVAAATKSLSYADVLAAKQIAILKTIPPDLMRRFSSVKGPIFNTWMVGHPLVLQSQLHSDVVQMISESPLSESKKLEWELDVLREHDEKKMDRLEKILISKRNSALEQSQSLSYIHFNSNTTTADASKPSRTNKKTFLTVGGSSNSVVGTSQSSYNGSTMSVSNNSGGNRSNVAEYYMDRGRQPNKY